LGNEIKKTRWAQHVVYTGVKRYKNRALMGEPERNRPLERSGDTYI